MGWNSLFFFDARRREPHGPSIIEQVKKTENYATKVEVIE